MEQAGRILRAQASRKQVFQTILPLLSAGLIRPAEGKRPAKKDYRQIREQVRALRAEQQEAGEEADAFMAMTNLIEQACNYYLETGAFPATYEEVQAVPVQQVGQLPFAGDDGMHSGQTYRARLSVAQSCDLSTRAEARRASLFLSLRAPDPRGHLGLGRLERRDPLARCRLCLSRARCYAARSHPAGDRAPGWPPRRGARSHPGGADEAGSAAGLGAPGAGL